MNNEITLAAVELYNERSFGINNELISNLVCCYPNDKHQKLKRLGFVENKYESVTRLTFAERKINFTAIKKMLDEMDRFLKGKLEGVLNKQSASVVREFRRTVETGNLNDVARFKVNFGGEVADVLKDTQLQMYEFGKKSSADEIKSPIPKTKKETAGIFYVQGKIAEDKIASNMEAVARQTGLNVNTGAAQKTAAIAAMTATLEKQVISAARNAAAYAIIGGMNSGRNAVFMENPEKIYAFQYTAVLDGKTTNLCRSLNGRVVSPNNRDFLTFSPPLHPHCRSMWVAIMQDEFIKPAKGKIPGYIDQSKLRVGFQDLPKVRKIKPQIAPGQEALLRTRSAAGTSRVDVDALKKELDKIL